MKKNFYITIVIFVSSLLWACNDGDNFSSDSSYKLAFDTDSVCFETVFTTIGSATKQFKIYNRNNKSLHIESIHLKGSARSGFRINIDGEKGDLIRNVDIYKKDSLFAFVEITVDMLNKDTPVILRDTIEFSTNGNIQRVYLEAIGQDVHMWKGKAITADTVLTANKPYLIYDSLVVKKGINLKLEEGVTFYFRKKASLHIHGTLEARGTVEKPILMRGDRFDNVDTGILFDNVDGQWDGIYFYPNSYNNYLENVHTRNGSNGMMFYESKSDTQKATLINTIVHNTSISGVTAINCKIDAVNSLFTNSKGAALAVIGGKYTFTHCTIANYYRWSTREKHALVLSNRLGLEKLLPLEKCDIKNSIVYGSAKSEISLEYTNPNNFVYRFDHCLLKKEVEDGNRYTNIVWNKDPLFENLNIAGNYVYDFHIKGESPAIGNAKKLATVLYDLEGNPRPDASNDKKPDIGSYEYVAK